MPDFNPYAILKNESLITIVEKDLSNLNKFESRTTLSSIYNFGLNRLLSHFAGFSLAPGILSPIYYLAKKGVEYKEQDIICYLLDFTAKYPHRINECVSLLVIFIGASSYFVSRLVLSKNNTMIVAKSLAKGVLNWNYFEFTNGLNEYYNEIEFYVPFRVTQSVLVYLLHVYNTNNNISKQVIINLIEKHIFIDLNKSSKSQENCILEDFVKFRFTHTSYIDGMQLSDLYKEHSKIKGFRTYLFYENKELTDYFLEIISNLSDGLAKGDLYYDYGSK